MRLFPAMLFAAHHSDRGDINIQALPGAEAHRFRRVFHNMAFIKKSPLCAIRHYTVLSLFCLLSRCSFCISFCSFIIAPTDVLLTNDFTPPIAFSITSLLVYETFREPLSETVYGFASNSIPHLVKSLV